MAIGSLAAVAACSATSHERAVIPSSDSPPSASALTPIRPPEAIIFASNRSGNFDLYEEDLATGALQNLTHSSCDENNPEVSPDNSELVYYQECQGQPPQIAMLDLKNPAHPSHILNPNVADNYDPVFMQTPTGLKIIYKTDKDDGKGDIARMNLDGSDSHNLTPAMHDTEEWKPEPMPGDLTHLIITSGTGKNVQLYKLDIVTKTATPLIHGPQHDIVRGWYPAMNPDGKRLTFIAKAPGQPDGPDTLFTLNLQTDQLVQVTHPQSLPGDAGDPSWSRDGTKLFFVHDPSDGYQVKVKVGDTIKTVDGGQAGSKDLAPVEVQAAA
ncbi:MAG TPA: hypothetical protein VLF60_02795 [Candidatus Saccharimonadales bacterium]|nr:hypothetical protein [Candidatus Saccharimonadales bacterium]